MEVMEVLLSKSYKKNRRVNNITSCVHFYKCYLMYLQKCLQSVCDVSSIYANSKIIHVYGLLLLATPCIKTLYIILHNNANCIIYSTKKYKNSNCIKLINDGTSKILLRLERRVDTWETFKTYLISHSTCHIFESSVDCVLYRTSSDIQPMFLF